MSPEDYSDSLSEDLSPTGIDTVNSRRYNRGFDFSAVMKRHLGPLGSALAVPIASITAPAYEAVKALPDPVRVPIFNGLASTMQDNSFRVDETTSPSRLSHVLRYLEGVSDKTLNRNYDRTYLNVEENKLQAHDTAFKRHKELEEVKNKTHRVGEYRVRRQRHHLENEASDRLNKALDTTYTRYENQGKNNKALIQAEALEKK